MAYLIYTATREIISAHTQTELVTNGDFDTDSDWGKGGTWTIGSGTANHSVASPQASSDLTQTLAMTAGTDYIVTFTISGRSAGTVTAKLGTTSGTARSTDATYVETITTDGTTLTFTASGDFDGSIDDVSVVITDSWELAVPMASYEYPRQVLKSQSVAMDGTTETVFIRKDNLHKVVTAPIAEANLTSDGWFEFIASTQAGESFTFDPTGSPGSPDNPLTCVIESDAFPTRAGPFMPYFTISLDMREL